ncbi:hypothetical protein NGB36_17280 [Streptomyces sp. RB6PN25]|uniref:Resolvase HTH domain-containing protein n=1 Tax=Streptomyces humicola TaxID=2953240 RepID=A0ABT1PX95_9ACTN|nr:hypothetical protein [Streptomyces humicola]MCQ4082308.1 hypothetical protein [Streptomyces humicola]
MYDVPEKTVQQIADLFGVPRSTVYGHLNRDTTVPRQPKKNAAKSEDLTLDSQVGLLPAGYFAPGDKGRSPGPSRAGVARRPRRRRRP